MKKKKLLKTNNMSINNRIFQGNLPALLFSKYLSQYNLKTQPIKTTIEKIKHWFCMDDLMLYAKNSDNLEELLSTVKI